MSKRGWQDKKVGSGKNVAVVIGRFSPFHNGHLHVVETAAAENDYLVIVFGSARQARTWAARSCLQLSDWAQAAEHARKALQAGRQAGDHDRTNLEASFVLAQAQVGAGEDPEAGHAMARSVLERAKAAKEATLVASINAWLSR